MMTKKEKAMLASVFGRMGGMAKSAKKTAAVRKNGQKGGRPKKAVDTLTR